MRRPVGVPAALVSVLAVIAIIAATATLATQGRSSPAAGLTGVVWLWTETTTVRDPVPSIVPAPLNYSVEFGGDRRFRAKADCTAAAGTFRVILPGRMGPSPGLAITPDPGDRAPCGEGSLAETFLRDLDRAVAYSVVGDLLTITLSDGTQMAFRSAA
jgi:hypothetical protein